MLVLCAVVRPAGQRTMSFKLSYGKEKRHAEDAAAERKVGCTNDVLISFLG
jgi:hypothetical protein